MTEPPIGPCSIARELDQTFFGAVPGVQRDAQHDYLADLEPDHRQGRNGTQRNVRPAAYIEQGKQKNEPRCESLGQNDLFPTQAMRQGSLKGEFKYLSVPPLGLGPDCCCPHSQSTSECRHLFPMPNLTGLSMKRLPCKTRPI